MSGSCSWGGSERSPLGSVFAEMWKMSLSRTCWTCRSTLSAKRRIELRQHVPPVDERPDLADRLVADAGHDPADIFHHEVDGGDFVGPVLGLARRLIENRVALVVLDVGEAILVGGLVGHVVHAGPDIDDRLEARVLGDILHPLAVHPDLAAVLQPLPVLLASADHECILFPERKYCTWLTRSVKYFQSFFEIDNSDELIPSGAALCRSHRRLRKPDRGRQAPERLAALDLGGDRAVRG